MFGLCLSVCMFITHFHENKKSDLEYKFSLHSDVTWYGSYARLKL